MTNRCQVIPGCAARPFCRPPASSASRAGTRPVRPPDRGADQRCAATDVPDPRHVSRSHRAGIRLFGYRGGLLRTKTCTIDGQWSTIGTSHLDLLSSVVNYECNVEIYDATIAAQMRDLFEHDAAAAVELSTSRWMNRPWYTQLGERLLAPPHFLL
jgi:cardiolipin synthase A/B